jgi:hypothetical protein
MAATAPKRSARGLELSADAAPVLSGTLLLVLEAVAPLAVRDRVGEEMVPLMLLEGMMEADAAAVEALEIRLTRADEADAATELADDLALEIAAEADDAADEAG